MTTPLLIIITGAILTYLGWTGNFTILTGVVSGRTETPEKPGTAAGGPKPILDPLNANQIPVVIQSAPIQFNGLDWNK